jgi:hypothetical protein
VKSRDVYLQGPGLALAVSGAAVARGYFGREYGEVAVDGAHDVLLEAIFARAGEGASTGVLLEGRHKLARWEVRVTVRDGGPVDVRAHVQGPFGLPLVQSLVVEPLLGLVAARRELALIPGALLLDADGRGVLAVGGSGSGKTSLAARAIAAGREVLADDRVFVDAAATGSRYARRMRLYPDIAQTAPAAWSALTPAAQAKLRAVTLVRRVSGGSFAPPVAVARHELGATRRLVHTHIDRVLLLHRHDGDAPRLSAATTAAAADEIDERLLEDRAALDVAALQHRLRSLALHDRAIIESALATATIERLEIPRSWPAARAVQRLGAELGLP